MVLHTNTYELLNPPRASRSSLGRVFIYLLLLNVSDDVEPSPYYVGTTSQLSKRFGGHAEIHWHWNTYNTAPKIYIVGTVDIDEGLSAVTELKTLLTEQGHFLRRDSGERKIVPVNKTKDSLEHAFIDIPDEWYQKFSIKTGAKTVVKKKGGVEDQNVPLPNPTSEQVKKFFEQTNLNLNERVLYNYLADLYNPVIGKVIIDANDSMIRMLQVSKKRNKFFVIPPVLPHKGKIYLPLQKSLKAKMGDILI